MQKEEMPEFDFEDIVTLVGSHGSMSVDMHKMLSGC